MSPRRSVVALALTAVIAATAFAGASSGAADDRYPLLYVGGDHHDLNGSGYLSLDAFDLDWGKHPETQALTLTTPPGYRISLAQAAGSKIGFALVATVKSARGKVTTKNGSLTVLSAADFAADASAQACAPGKHAAFWQLSAPPYAIPIAVDRAQGGLSLKMCFDSFHTKHLIVGEVYFELEGVLRNPGRSGSYLFDARATPFTSGVANTAATYEMRAYELLPQTLSISARYSKSTKTVTISGRLMAQGKPRDGVRVHVLAGKTENGSAQHEIGVAETASDGTFMFTKKMTAAPAFSYVHANHYVNDNCSGTTSAPGGCISHSTDGLSSDTVAVAAR